MMYISFDEFHHFFIDNVLKLMQEQHTRSLTMTRKAAISDQADQINESVLRQLYQRFSDKDGRLSYKIMCDVLQTLLRNTSFCYSLLINVVDPRTDKVEISETARTHSLILKVIRLLTMIFLLL